MRGSTQKTMLTALPQDLAHSILQDWIDGDLRTLSDVECAHTNRRQRRDFLQALRRVQPNKVSNQQVMHRISACSSTAQFSRFIRWIKARDVRIVEMIVNFDVVDEVASLVAAHRCSWPHIRVLRFTLETNGRPVRPVNHYLFEAFLASFPSVTELDFRGCAEVLTNEDLLHVKGKFFTSLRVLDLWKAYNLKAEVVSAVASRFADSLQQLLYFQWNSAALEALMLCPNLTKLIITVDNITHEDLYNVCREHPLLEELELDMNFPTFSMCDDTLQQISLLCPNLRSIDVGQFTHFVTGAAVAYFRMNCPKIEQIVLLFHEISICTDARTGSKCCEISLQGGFPEDLRIAADIMRHCELPVRKMSGILESNCLAMLTDRCDALESLGGFAAQWVTLPMLTALLVGAKNLRVLMLQMCSMVDDTLVRSLPKTCPLIETLGLADATAVSDAAMIYMLQSFAKQQSNLNTLYLTRNPQLTDSVLVTAVDLLPKLEKISIHQTSITPSIVLGLMTFKRRMGKLKILLSSEDRRWVLAQLDSMGLREADIVLEPSALW